MKTIALLILLCIGVAQAQPPAKKGYQNIPVQVMQPNGRVVVYWVQCKAGYANPPNAYQIRVAQIKIAQIYLRKAGAR